MFHFRNLEEAAHCIEMLPPCACACRGIFRCREGRERAPDGGTRLADARSGGYRKPRRHGHRGTLAILGYDKIGEAPKPWYWWHYISKDVFAEQLRCLADGGWQLLDRAALIDSLDCIERLPPRAALLAFDDADQSFREHA